MALTILTFCQQFSLLLKPKICPAKLFEAYCNWKFILLPCVWLEDSVGWVGSIPCFRNGSNPFFVWMKKYQKIGSNPILCLVEEIEKRDGGPCSRRWLLHLLAPAGPTYQWHRSSFFLLRPSSSSIHHQSRAALLRRPTLLK